MSVEEDGAQILHMLQNITTWTTESRNHVIAWWQSHNLQLDDGTRSEVSRWMSIRLGNFEQERLRPHMILPEHSWLHSYLEYTSFHEAAEIFHFWVAVTMLGAAVGRRIWFDQYYFRVHCNHFVILAGDTGVRKTAAADIGVGILQAALPGYSVIFEKVTPEALLEALSHSRRRRRADNAEYCESMVYAPELAVFLGKQSYNESLVPLITSIADSKEHPMDYLTKHQGKYRLPRATLSMLGCSTPQWLADALPPSAHTGGFMGRFVFVMCNYRERLSAFPGVTIRERGEEQHRLLSRYLSDYLTLLSEIEAVITQSPEAQEWHENWYKSLKITGDTYLAGFHERKQSHLVRLAMVMMLSEDPLSTVIEVGHYERALAIINETEKHMPEAFAQVDQSDEGRMHARVLRLLKSAGGWVPRSMILRSVYKTVGSARRLAEVLVTLEQAGLVESSVSETGGTNYRVTSKAGDLEEELS